MFDFTAMTPKQTAHYAYMCDVMRRLEWDLHHTIAETGRIRDDRLTRAERMVSRIAEDYDVTWDDVLAQSGGVSIG